MPVQLAARAAPSRRRGGGVAVAAATTTRPALKPACLASPHLRRRHLAVPASASSSSSSSSSSSPPAPPTFHPSRLPPYERLLANLARVRETLGDAHRRPLSHAEKILYSHLLDPRAALQGAGSDPSEVRGKRYLPLAVDRLAMQDASAQMALLQFMTCGLPRTAIPSSIHCDHLIQAFEGAEADLRRSVASNQEVFTFLESAARKYGIEFWAPGSGIIHQIVLENYAAPGLLMLGTDSHTPNASGLGCLAIGVGGADAVDAMTATPWELLAPQILSVHLTGRLSPWCTPKDVILHLAGRLTVRGGTGKIIEYSGEGLSWLSATGLATMSNMGAEVGATTSSFAYTPEMGRYLDATGRAEVRRQAEKAHAAGLLSADEGVEFDERVEIDLASLEPCLNGPFTPDLSTPLSKFVERARSGSPGHPLTLSAALIGSCTNSSYADMARCASLARQASARGLKVKSSFDVTPGSEQVRATVERDGIEKALRDVGGRVLANACGPCIGQWDRRELQGEDNVILTSFNRNFRGRNDGNGKTMNLLASPEIVTAMAFAGRLDFNPMTDSLTAPDGEPFRFEPPRGEELPSRGFAPGDVAYLPTPCPEPVPDAVVAIDPQSSRLEPLLPFESPFADAAGTTANYELPPMRCLLRIRGKCTTDHISAAGPWLKYKGHLSNIAENTLIGATNDEDGKVNSAHDYMRGESSGGPAVDTIPAMAKRFKARGQAWMMVGDDNYGEGSAREHAALQVRLLGCQLLLARSVARIAETNLRKQGVLTLAFVDPADYARVGSGDVVETLNLARLLRPDADADEALRTQVRLRVTKFGDDGVTVRERFELPTRHSLSKAHLDWIRAGSALNLIREAALAAQGGGGGGGGVPLPSSTSPPPQGQVRAMHTSARPRGVFPPSSTPATPTRSAQQQQQQRRGYASPAAKPASSSRASGGATLNPNDPRYVAPAADRRTEAIRQIVYPAPTGAAASPSLTKAEAMAAAHAESRAMAMRGAMPWARGDTRVASEVHDTVVRAWKLHERTARERRQADLRAKWGRMREAVEALRRDEPALYERARRAQLVPPTKRSEDEVASLRRLGVLPTPTPRRGGAAEGEEGNAEEAPTSTAVAPSAEARRKARAVSGARLPGLFPREMRPPTLTPPRKGWPAYLPPPDA